MKINIVPTLWPIIFIFIFSAEAAPAWQIFTKNNSPLNGISLGNLIIDNANRIWAGNRWNDSIIVFKNGRWYGEAVSEFCGGSCNVINSFLDKDGVACFNIANQISAYTANYSAVKYKGNAFSPVPMLTNCSDWLRADQIIADTANNLLCNVIISSNMFSSTELGIFRVSASTCSSIVDFQKADSLIKIADSSIYVNTSTLAGAIAVDSNNTLWMTMLAGSDLYQENYGLFHIFGDSITIFNRWNSPLPSNNVNSIYVDSSNVIWIGIYNAIARLHDTTWTIYSISNSGLQPSSVLCFKRSFDGSMWIGTDHGAIRFKNNQWEAFTTTNSPLPDNWVQQIAEDSSGNIWMAAGTYLAVYNPNGVNFVSSLLQSRSEHEIAAPISRLVFGFSSRVDQAMSAARYFDIRGRDMGRVGFSGQSKGVCIMRRNGAR